MGDFAAADFGDLIAARIKAEHVALSARWLNRLRAFLTVPANEIFPTEHLLDHIPALIQEIAIYLQAPDAEAVAANTAVIAKAQQLGELRHSQKASVHQLLAEYRLLGGILSTFVQEESTRLGLSPDAAQVLELHRRLHDALWTLLQTTVDTFVTEYTGTIADHASRLESFNRMVSHELRQPLGTLTYAVPLLKAATAQGETAKQAHLFEVMERNIRSLVDMIEKLEIVSRLQTRPADTPEVQFVELAAVAGEVSRQLREMAEAREVEIVIADDLPSIVIDMARVELILMNLVSNAVKYSDPAKAQRVVRIEVAQADDAAFCTLIVRDNGLGIPREILPRVFERFVRAHSGRDIELQVRGSGLGLAIVAECVEAVGGEIALDSTPGQGTAVSVKLPRKPRQQSERATQPN